ncbi:hypothetical protein ACA910_012537 [Epithemia clementina (nom. ined.)]
MSRSADGGGDGDELLAVAADEASLLRKADHHEDEKDTNEYGHDNDDDDGTSRDAKPNVQPPEPEPDPQTPRPQLQPEDAPATRHSQNLSKDLADPSQPFPAPNRSTEKEDAEVDDERPSPSQPPHPYETASWISRWCFTWPEPLLKLGMERPLTQDDLPPILLQDSSAYNLQYLQSIYDTTASSSSSSHPRSLRRALLRDFFTTAALTMQPLMLASMVARITQAVCLGFLINVFVDNNDDDSNNNSNQNEGYLWAMGIVLCGLVILFEFHMYAFLGWRKGMQYRVACVATILDKTLRLSSTSTTTNTQTTTSTTPTANGSNPTTTTSNNNGRILNLASNDVERFMYTCVFSGWMLWAPIQALTIALVGSLWLLGPAFSVGVGVLIAIFVPLQMYLSRQFSHYRSTVARQTDARVHWVSQALRGARVMKLCGYETPFEQRIRALRSQEVQPLQAAFRFKAANEALYFVTNVVVSLIIFLVHVLWFDGTLTPGDIFTVFSLVNVMQLEMVKYGSMGLMSLSECMVSIGRIQEFLEFPEHDDGGDGDDKKHESKEKQGDQQIKVGDGVRHESEESSNCVISMKTVCCRWDKVKHVAPLDQAHRPTSYFSSSSTTRGSGVGNLRQLSKFSSRTKSDVNSMVSKCSTLSSASALEDVTVDFDAGALTCVIGPVGSGKSALLLALTKELAVTSGSIYRKPNQTLAYAAQDPWIMDGSIQENILMGHPYNAEWYATVIESCSLSLDFDELRDADQTLVGDRGVQLSGGQRARVGLARALYKNADILIVDDPLSAVDARVGRHIFQQAILRLSVQQGKCVVLATHQHQYINESRCILVLSGRIGRIGSYEECVAASNGKLKAHEADTTTSKVPLEDEIMSSSAAVLNKDVDDGDKDNKNKDSASASSGIIESKADSTRTSTTPLSKKEQSERHVQGLVQAETFVNYMKALGGVWIVLILLVIFMATQASVLVTTATMARWAERDSHGQHDSDIIDSVVGMSGLVVLLSILRAYLSLELMLKASQSLHDRMAHAVLRAKIEFFDTNPLGRILNRFSADTGIADDQLPQTLFDLMVFFFIVLGAVVTALTTLPFALVVIPFLVWYFARVRNVFVTSTRELKRLEGIARSPIFAMLGEALNGIGTIRANGYIPHFRKKFQEAHDAHTRVFFAFISASRWVGFRMDVIVFTFISIVSFLAVLVQEKGWFDVDPAILGLALSMLIYISGVFQAVIRFSADVVNHMISVERIIEYGKLESEAPLRCDIDDELESKGWPNAGKIEYDSVSVRYRQSLPLALRQISFVIPAGARVGVVGRTGSGKSTVVQTLLRLLESEEGRILLDGQDIAKVGLHTLRTGISVIPQTPTLFSGCSVRENLDLFGLYTDDEVRTVLTSCHLQDVIAELSDGWDSTVMEGGSNFSVGQRQLLCLARALLSKNKILVLDEATASVDRRTDHLLQQALQESYHDGTIIAVAHRLDTVIDYDFVLVLGHGEVLEFGSPADLLSNRDSMFSCMVDDTGDSMSKTLREQANLAGKKDS